MIAISTLLLYGLIIFVLNFIWTFIIRPYLGVKYYERQGLKAYYYPILGYIKHFIEGVKKHDDAQYFLRQFVKNHPESDGFVINFGKHVYLFLGTPELNKEVTSKHWTLFRELELQPLKMAGCKEGLTLVHQDLWKKHRAMVSGTFRYDILSEKLHHVYNSCDEILDKLPTGHYVEYTKYALDITAIIMGKIFFGERVNKYEIDGLPFTHYLLRFLNFAGDLIMDPMRLILGSWVVNWGLTKEYRRFNHEAKMFRTKVIEILEERRKNPTKSNDLIEQLLETQKDPNPEGRFSNDVIVDEIMTFSNVASENTALMSSLVLWALCKNPQYYDRLFEENKKFYKKNLKMDELMKIEFLNAFINETLRLYTTSLGLVPRISIADQKIGKFDVKTGTRIWILYFMNFINQKYFPNPDVFDPDRWLRPETKNLDTFVFTPFSAGPRNCLGKHLALAEIVIMVSEVLRRFKFELDPTYKMVRVSRFLYQPKEYIRMKFTPLDAKDK